MHKLLFFILSLCCTMTAWAGTGNGTKENPYTGEWQVTELASKLKVGDRLGYYCVLKNGYITVTDHTLDQVVTNNFKDWAVGDPIDNQPWVPYLDYCTHNDMTARQQQTFIITGLSVSGQSILDIVGHYSGAYENQPGTVSDTIKVATAQQLYDAFFGHLDDRKVVIKLCADIDMEAYSERWGDRVSADLPTFQGTIDGYYTLRDTLGNIELDPDGTPALAQHVLSNYHHKLAFEMQYATLKGIKFAHWTKTTNWTGDFGSMMISTIARNSTFQDITFEDCSYDDGSIGQIIGMMAKNYGLMFSELYDSTVQGVRFLGCTFIKQGSVVGFITGTADNTVFRNCYTEHFSSIFAEKSCVGGLVGSANVCTFEDCVNMASVSGSENADNVGGLTGKCTLCTFTNCINTGPLTQSTRQSFEAFYIQKMKSCLEQIRTISGLATTLCKHDLIWKYQQLNNVGVGPLKVRDLDNFIAQKNFKAEAYAESQIKGCLLTVAFFLWTVKGEIDAILDPDEMGGMSGAAYGCTFSRCLNSGLLHCLDAYCGGIVGKAGKEGDKPTEFYHCVNRGYVHGDEQTGGIVGSLKGGHLYYCLNTGAVDCVHDTRGSMYGESDIQNPVTSCFALARESEYTFGQAGGEKTFNVSLLDIKSGRVAYELNRLSGTNYYRQSVGQNTCPMFDGDIVTLGDIRDDISLPYEVHDADEFVFALFDQYADIILKDDIDLEEQYFSVYRETFPFCGSIDGQGHAIKNMKADIESSDTDLNKWHWLAGYQDYFGLLGATDGAMFKNLELKDCVLRLPHQAAMLCAVSRNTVYDHVSITGKSSVTANRQMGGLVYSSTNDTFIGCTIGDSCQVGSLHLSYFDYDGEAGGLASKATGSTFTDCANNGEVYSRTDGAGGLVTRSNACTFFRCVNNGYVHHSSTIIENDDEIGGIAATAENSDFNQCVNNGHIRCNDEYGGGIVGRGVNVQVVNCLNTSENLEFDTSTCGAIIGEAKESLIYNCCSSADYPIIGNVSIFGISSNSGNNFRVLDKNTRTTEYELTVTRAEMKSGLVAQYLNDGLSDNQKGLWRQNLTEHDGMKTDDCPSLDPNHDLVNSENRALAIAITTPEELMAFAKRVNEDKEQFASAHLEADIDMTGCEWTPIGTNAPNGHYRGCFDGRGHTIKNLTVSGNAAAGLFGAAHVGADIRNLIIGEGSTITCNGDEGAGGILGQVYINWKWGEVRIENCGSYADIHVKQNGGGILGRVRTDDNSNNFRVIVNNCFSTGVVSASEGNSALLCGYMKNHGVVSNSWSIGDLVSTTSYDPYEKKEEYFVGYDQTLDIKNCHASFDNLLHAEQTGVSRYSTNVIAEGGLTYHLNGDTNDATQSLTWQQNLGTDAHPVFGDKGLYHTRTVSNEYGTVCLPYVLKSDDAISYYTFTESVGSGSEVSLKFDYAETVAPGTPALFKVTTLGEIVFNCAGAGLAAYPVAPDAANWTFTGTYEERTFVGEDLKTKYYVSNGAIKHSTNSLTIQPNRAYFEGPSIDVLTSYGTAKAKIRLFIDGVEDEATALEIIADDLVPVQDSKGYNLFGNMVGEGYRGIVIKKSKKYISNLNNNL